MNRNTEATSASSSIHLQNLMVGERNPDASHEYSGISSASDEHDGSNHEQSIYQESLQAENDQQPLVPDAGTQNDGFRFTLWLGIQLLFTNVIVVLIAVTIKTYQKMGNMSTRQKHAFNTIVTALILFLGLSFFVSV